jgi:predicted Fe-Mo cluster-binding NifX family protein/DNA-binding PadR family transcriptional regulator
MWNGQRHCGRRGCNRRIGQFLDPALLLLLEQAPAHGYTLLSRMPEFGLDFLAPTVIYRALREMEAREWISSVMDDQETQGPPRRIYALTSLGREILRCCLEQLRSTQQIIEYVLALHDELEAHQEPEEQPKNPLEEERVMRIVIPADGTDLDAPTSAVFGRCPTFIFVDPETLEFEAWRNEAVSAPGGAGVQASQTVVQRRPHAVIAPSLGPNAFRVIQAAGIPCLKLEGATVREVVEAYNAGELSPLDTAGPDHVVFGGGRRGQV